MMPSDSNKPITVARSQPQPPDQTPVPGLLANQGAWPTGMVPGQQLPPGLAPPPAVGALVQALRRRLVLGLGVATAGAILGVVAVWIVFPPKYATQTRLELTSHRPKQIFT